MVKSLEISLDIVKQAVERGNVKVETGYTGQKLGKVMAEMKDFIEYLKK